jgi:hypothetical protein
MEPWPNASPPPLTRQHPAERNPPGKIASWLAMGETTKKAAKRFRVSPGRISQLRRELQQDWDDFQGGPAFA